MKSLPAAATVRKDLKPYLPFFRDVPMKAWARTLVEGPVWMDTTTRKNLAWDAMRDIARQEAPTYGLQIVEIRRGRPLPLVLVTGKRHDYCVRFNNLSDKLVAGGWPTQQRRMFENQGLPMQPVLPGMRQKVNLRAGYVLDELGLAIVRTPIVLSYKNSPVWAFDIGHQQAPSAPIIKLAPKPQPQPAIPTIASHQQTDTETGTDEGS